MNVRSDMSTLVQERELPYPPARVWRALTERALLGEWLMESDFRAEVGASFTFHADWGEVTGEVLAVEPERRLSYSWVADSRLDSVVTWTLEATASGTRLTMEQTGFTPEKRPAYLGARAGWPRILDALETLLARGGGAGR